jgi:hypothetical protein
MHYKNIFKDRKSTSTKDKHSWPVPPFPTALLECFEDFQRPKGLF